MTKGEYLGELEQLVLLAVQSLGDEAYGITVRQLLQDRAGRVVSVPTVYSALDRLEQKGYVAARMGEATAERGGRAKRLYRVERAGMRALQAVKRMQDRMWEAARVRPKRT